MKLIDLTTILQHRKDEENADWFQKGFAELLSLPEEQADKVVVFIVNYILLELKIRLGIVDVNADLGFKFADAIIKIVREAEKNGKI